MNRKQLKHAVYLAIAQEFAKLATCERLHVGCVLLRSDGSVAGTGYNGSLPGRPHCTPETCRPDIRCWRTRHAERSALDYSVGDVAVAYSTHEPCIRCTQDLIARGCRAVYFLEPYAARDEAENEAKRRHIEEAGLRWVWMNEYGKGQELRANGRCLDCGLLEWPPYRCPVTKKDPSECSHECPGCGDFCWSEAHNRFEPLPRGPEDCLALVELP